MSMGDVGHDEVADSHGDEQEDAWTAEDVAASIRHVIVVAESTYKALREYLLIVEKEPKIWTSKDRSAVMRAADAVGGVVGTLRTLELALLFLPGSIMCGTQGSLRDVDTMRLLLEDTSKLSRFDFERKGELGPSFFIEPTFAKDWVFTAMTIEKQNRHLAFASHADSLAGLLSCLGGFAADSKRQVHRPLEIPARIPLAEAASEVLDSFKGDDVDRILVTLSTKFRDSPVVDAFLQDEPYQDWDASPESRCLCICSPASMAKSAIVAKMAESSLAVSRKTASHGTCYYFVDKPTAMSRVLGSLLLQLCAQSLKAYQQLRKELKMPKESLSAGVPNTKLHRDYQKIFPSYDKDFKATDMNDTATLARLLDGAASCFESLTVIIDSPDNVNSVDDEVVNLQKILCPLVVSHPRARLIWTVSKQDVSHPASLLIEWQPQRADISQDLQTRLREAFMRSGLLLGQDAVESAALRLIRTSTDLSLLDMQVKWLCADTTNLIWWLERSMFEFPDTIKGTVDWLSLRRWDEDEIVRSRDRRLLKSCLSLLAWAEPPLSTSQLCEVSSVLASRDATSLRELHLVTEVDVLRVGPGLIERSKEGQLQLLSNHLKTCLQSEDPDGSETSACDGLKTNLDLLDACLRFLRFEDFLWQGQSFSDEEERIEQRRRFHPFYTYAAVNWPKLAASMLIIDSPVSAAFKHPTKPSWMVSWLVEYCINAFPTRFQLRDHTGMAELITTLTHPGLTTLHVAAAFGFVEECAKLLELEPELITRQSPLGTPIVLALLGPAAFGIRKLDVVANGVPSSWTEAWSSQATRALRGQRETIILLAAAHPQADPNRMPAVHGRQIFVAELAYVVACEMRDLQVFQEVLNKAGFFEEMLVRTVAGWPIHFECPTVPTVAARLNAKTTVESKAFANDMYQWLLDKISPWIIRDHGKDSLKNHAGSIHHLAQVIWDRGKAIEAPFVSRATRRKIDCPNEQFFACIPLMLRDYHPAMMQRMIQDPRWPVNQSLDAVNEGDEYEGQTALHIAAESNLIEVAEALIENGSELTIADAKGRVPLLLVEEVSMLKLLLDKGASLEAVDDEGRSLWHVAAATNDVDILAALLERCDTAVTQASLRKLTKKGRTPLAEALLYISELQSAFPPLPPPAGTRAPVALPQYKPRAAELLLAHCVKDREYFSSDEPLALVAVEWASESLLKKMEEAGGADFGARGTYGGITALHCLNSSATKHFVKSLLELCPYAPQVFDDRGRTPAEVMLFNLKTKDPGGDTPLRLSMHPSMRGVLDKDAYSLLLTKETVESINSRDETFWERICKDLILAHATSPKNLQAGWPNIRRAYEVFQEKGVLTWYETKRERPAVLPVAQLIRNAASQGHPVRGLDEHFFLKILRDSKHSDLLKGDEDINWFLQWAVANDRQAVVAFLVEKQVSVYQKVNGCSAFETVCMAGRANFDTFEQVLAAAVAENAEALDNHTLNGLSALQILCAEEDPSQGTLSRREDRVQAILKAGAQPSSTTALGTPSVCYAMNAKQYACAEILLKAGAKWNVKGSNGFDLVQAATATESLRMLRLIRERAPDWDWRESVTTLMFNDGGLNDRVARSCNAMHLACYHGHIAIVNFFLENNIFDVMERSRISECTPLHFAAAGRELGIMELLVKRGADIEAVDSRGNTPLHTAAVTGFEDAVKCLIDLGADKTAKNKDGVEPVIRAVGAMEKSAFRYLADKPVTEAPKLTPAVALERQETIREAKNLQRRQDTLGQALLNAMRDNDMDQCGHIFKSGFPVDRTLPGCGGCSPLIWAVWRNKVGLVRSLLDYGARKLSGHCSRHHPQGFSVLVMACRVIKDQKCLKMILDTCMKVRYNIMALHIPPLLVAMACTNEVATDVLLSHVKDHVNYYEQCYPRFQEWRKNLKIQVRPEAEGTPMILRAFINLAVRDYDWDRGYPWGTTALHIAAASALPSTVKLLIDMGAAVNARDHYGETPLHVLARKAHRKRSDDDSDDYDENNDKNLVADKNKCIEQLLEWDADINAVDWSGATPLLLAAGRGDDTTVMALLKRGARHDLVDVYGRTFFVAVARECNVATFRHCTERLKLDPYEYNFAKTSPLHQALLNEDYASHILNGDFDLSWSEPQSTHYAKNIVADIVNDNASSLLNKFLHRVDPAHCRRLVDERAGGKTSALCLAAGRNYDADLEVLLKHGADLELEGSDEFGTALMVACARGHVDAARVLLGAGARMVYFSKRDGVVRSAVDLASGFEDMVEYLLVRRYTEAVLITAEPHQVEAGQAEAEEVEMRPRAGIVAVEVRLAGVGKEYAWKPTESMLEWLKRREEIKDEFAGCVVVPLEEEEEED